MAAKRTRKGSQKGSTKKQPGLVAMTVAELERTVGRDTLVRVSKVSLREIARAATDARLEKKFSIAEGSADV